MDIHDLRYRKCAFCYHYFIEHYTTYTLGKNFKGTQGCSWKTFLGHYTDHITTETNMRACPCQGFSEILERDEYGNPIQQ